MKLWFIEVQREVEEPWSTHVRQDTKPTNDEIRKWFESECVDDWKYVGRITCYEVTQ